MDFEEEEFKNLDSKNDSPLKGRNVLFKDPNSSFISSEDK